MSKTSDKNSSVRLKRDHPNSSVEESISLNKAPSPPIKKLKNQHSANIMDKEVRNRYSNGSSSAFISSTSTKKLIIKNFKCLSN